MHRIWNSHELLAIVPFDVIGQNLRGTVAMQALIALELKKTLIYSVFRLKMRKIACRTTLRNSACIPKFAVHFSQFWQFFFWIFTFFNSFFRNFKLFTLTGGVFLGDFLSFLIKTGSAPLNSFLGRVPNGFATSPAFRGFIIRISGQAASRWAVEIGSICMRTWRGSSETSTGIDSPSST